MDKEVQELCRKDLEMDALQKINYLDTVMSHDPEARDNYMIDVLLHVLEKSGYADLVKRYKEVEGGYWP